MTFKRCLAAAAFLALGACAPEPDDADLAPRAEALAAHESALVVAGEPLVVDDSADVFLRSTGGTYPEFGAIQARGRDLTAAQLEKAIRENPGGRGLTKSCESCHVAE